MLAHCSPAIETVRWCTGGREYGTQHSRGCRKRWDRRRIGLPSPSCGPFQTGKNPGVKRKDVLRDGVGLKDVGSGDRRMRVHVTGTHGEGGSRNNLTVIALERTFSDKQMRLMLNRFWWGGFVAIGSFSLLTVLEYMGKLDSRFAQAGFVIFNAACALLCVLIMIPSTAWYVWCLVRVKIRGGVFDNRERWDHGLNLAMFLSQSVNCVAYLVPIAVGFIRGAEGYGYPFLGCTFIRFAMWTTIYWIFTVQTRLSNPWLDSEGKPVGDQVDSRLVDAPLSKHWYLPITWLLGQSLWVLPFYYDLMNEIQWKDYFGIDNSDTIRPLFLFLGLIFHRLTGMFFYSMGQKELSKFSFDRYRWANNKLRFNFRHFKNVNLVFILTFPIFTVLADNKAIESLLILTGFFPAQLAMTMKCAISCIVAAPVIREDYSEVDLDTNRLVWMESPVAGQNEIMNQIDTAPRFCFETALKARFWSWAAYNYDRKNKIIKDPKGGPSQAMALAMQMYDLTDHEYIVKPVCDSHVLIAWSKQTVVVSFRGTSSKKNALNDLKAWMIDYPAKQSGWLPGNQPTVHAGFANSWRSERLSTEVVGKVKKILGSKDFDKPNSKIIITGHSLGGAIAVLAAYDIAGKLEEDGLLPKEQIMCYTFGAPRVGNPTFAAKYDSQVPNTWQVVNAQDGVPCTPKFGVSYRHVGRKVLINSDGDVIVSPTILEFSLRTMTAFFRSITAAVSNHELNDYEKSFIKIMETTGKGVEGGYESVPKILDKSNKLLSKVYGVSSNDLLAG